MRVAFCCLSCFRHLSLSVWFYGKTMYLLPAVDVGLLYGVMRSCRRNRLSTEHHLRGALPQECIIDGFEAKNCKKRVKQRGNAADLAARIRAERTESLAIFTRNIRIMRIKRASRAIFTNYMIHRFIKHGKRFVELFHRNLSGKNDSQNMQEIMQVILQFLRGKNANHADFEGNP